MSAEGRSGSAAREERSTARVTVCDACRLPISLSKPRRELLERVAAGRWYDGPDSDLGRLEAAFKDGLVRWRDPGYHSYDPPGGYFITERGRALLDADDDADARASMPLLLAPECRFDEKPNG